MEYTVLQLVDMQRVTRPHHPCGNRKAYVISVSHQSALPVCFDNLVFLCDGQLPLTGRILAIYWNTMCYKSVCFIWNILFCNLLTDSVLCVPTLVRGADDDALSDWFVLWGFICMFCFCGGVCPGRCWNYLFNVSLCISRAFRWSGMSVCRQAGSGIWAWYVVRPWGLAGFWSSAPRVMYLHWWFPLVCFRFLCGIGMSRIYKDSEFCLCLPRWDCWVHIAGCLFAILKAVFPLSGPDSQIRALVLDVCGESIRYMIGSLRGRLHIHSSLLSGYGNGYP